MDIIKTISKELEIKTWQAEAVIKLIDEGNTIPFIARYRKEATGSLNDEVLRDFHDRLVYLRNLEEKKAQVLSSINDQGKLTPELKKMIEEALTMVAVDDLYRPYRPKRRTRAIIAKEKGLEPLANILMLQMTSKSMLEEAKMFVSDQKGVATAEEALNGAKDILAEAISDNADYRTYIRRITMNEGKVVSKARDINEKSVYENYYDYEEAVSKMPSHRILAINRGEKLKFLTVKVEAPEEKIIRYLEKKVIRKDNPETEFILKSVVDKEEKDRESYIKIRENNKMAMKKAEIERELDYLRRIKELENRESIVKQKEATIDRNVRASEESKVIGNAFLQMTNDYIARIKIMYDTILSRSAGINMPSWDELLAILTINQDPNDLEITLQEWKAGFESYLSGGTFPESWKDLEKAECPCCKQVKEDTINEKIKNN